MKNPSPYKIIVLLLIFIFLALKIPQVDFRYGDENIYFYMGQLVSQGQLPYVDFFFASPPPQILVLAFFILFFGFNIFLLKLIPLLCVAGTAWLIFQLVRKKAGELAGIFAVTFHLFSFVVLTTSDYFSGVEMVVFLILLAAYFLEKGRPIWSAIFATLALLTRLYAAPLVVALAFYVLISQRKNLWKFALTGTGVFLGANLLLYLAFGQNYLNDVLFYHLSKFEELDKTRVFNFFLRWDWLLLSLAAVSILIVKWKKIILPLLAAILVGVFLFWFKDIYYLYFNLLLPFLAILAGVVLAEILRIWSWSKKSFVISLLVVIFFLLILSGYNGYYYFQDHAGAARINYFSDLAEWLKNNSQPTDKIYGSFEIVPLLAGATGRQIAGNFIDTNNKTFSTGMFKLAEREKILAQEKPKFIITKVLIDNQGNLLELGSFISLEFLQKNCQIAKQYPIAKDYYSNLMLVWGCF